MARTRVRTARIASLLALSVALPLVTGCGGEDASSSGTDHKAAGHKPVVVATTTWEGAFAKAAGAEDVTVIVPQSVHHAPDYDPKPSDLAAVANADFVLYAPFEPYAAKIKEAAALKAKLVEVNLDNDPAKAGAEVTRLGGLFGTKDAAEGFNTRLDTEVTKLNGELKGTWPGGKSPAVVTQVFTAWAAAISPAPRRWARTAPSRSPPPSSPPSPPRSPPLSSTTHTCRRARCCRIRARSR